VAESNFWILEREEADEADADEGPGPMSTLRRAALLVAVVAAAGGCATASAGSDASSPGRDGAGAELRILALDPPMGASVGPTTEVTATLAYHIPDYDSTKVYMLSATFAASGRRSLGSGSMSTGRVTSAAGIVTVRETLRVLDGGEDRGLAEPLTGSFHLTAMDLSEPPDPGAAAGPTRVETVIRRVDFLARSRTFFYNGGGPARMMGDRSLLDLLETYWHLEPHRAMAVALAPDGRWTYGYASAYPDPAAAEERALRECRAGVARRDLDADCRLVADPGPTR
jgi:hypothetical protein